MAVSSLRNRQEPRVTTNTTRSDGVERHDIRIWCQLIIFVPTRMRWAASAATGIKLKTGVTRPRTRRTTALLSIEEIWVLAPLWKLTAERAKEDEPGTAPKNEQAMLAAPMPISSWFGSIFWPLFAARPFVIEAASSIPRIEMAMAVTASSGSRWILFGPKG